MRIVIERRVFGKASGPPHRPDHRRGNEMHWLCSVRESHAHDLSRAFDIAVPQRAVGIDEIARRTDVKDRIADLGDPRAFGSTQAESGL